MNESSRRSDSISIIYNGYDCSSAVKNSLVPLQQLTCILLMQTSTNTSSRPIYTGINQHKTIPSIWSLSQKANHAQSKSALVPESSFPSAHNIHPKRAYKVAKEMHDCTILSSHSHPISAVNLEVYIQR